MTQTAAGYPVVLQLQGLPVLIVGGGRVATHKAEGLLEAGASVAVTSPEVTPEIAELASQSKVRWFDRPYERGEVAGYRLAIAAAPTEVNRLVHRDAQAARVFINAVDDPSHCTFYLPSVLRRGDLTVSVGTSGRSPAFAAWLRRHLESVLDNDVMDLFALSAEARSALRRARGSSEHSAWRSGVLGRALETIRSADVDRAKLQLFDALGLSRDGVSQAPSPVGDGGTLGPEVLGVKSAAEVAVSR